jgi:hypothetical protein
MESKQAVRKILVSMKSPFAKGFFARADRTRCLAVNSPAIKVGKIRMELHAGCAYFVA